MSELLKINVNDHTEKKNNLTYLSWAWAWAEVLKYDPTADWDFMEYGPSEAAVPCMFLPDGTAMVKTVVTIKDKARSCMLPVMDHRNKAIKNPDAFAINTAIMRCMTKAISMHGLGLYIYAGEDLPEGDEPAEAPAKAPAAKRTGVMADVLATLPELDADWSTYYDELAANVEDTFTSKGAAAAYDRVKAEGLDNDGTTYLWSRLGSKVRSALKAEKNLRIGAG